MLGGSSDISQFFEHGFYDWVMFRDELIQHPDQNPELGRYLGPAIYGGLSMMAKTTKLNGEVVHFSTYPGLKEDENSRQVHIALRKDFDNIIRERSGPDISPNEFPDANLEDTPMYDMYDNDTTDGEGGLADKSEDKKIHVVDTSE